MNAESDAQSPASVTPSIDQNRIRIAKACSACSRQKLRCDGSQPCTRCRSLGSPELCVYLPSMRGKIKRKRVKSNTDTSEVLGSHHRSPTSTTSGNQRRRGVPENTELWESDQPQPQPGPSSLSYTSNSPRRSPKRLVGRRESASDLDHLTTTLPLPGDAHNPLAVLVELSEAATRRVQDVSPVPYQGVESSKRQREEEEYYAPLERTLKEEAPLIMALISTHEAKQLFDTFFTHLHPHLPLLDREQSAPSAIARRNNFLFNAICCSAARSHNVVIWSRLKDFARSEMERLPREKSIDVVQGHLIYSWWNLIRPTRFEQDMTWLRAGLACRTAVDIALHRVGLLEAARAGLPPSILKSFIRTWLWCFVVDRTLSVHLGKPNGRQWESEAVRYIDYLRQSSEYKGVQISPTEDDILTASLAEWALILSQAIDAFRLQGLQTSTMADSHGTPSSLSLIFAGQLEHWRETSRSRWGAARGNRKGSSGGAGTAVGDHFEVYENYARLVIQSLALQHAQDNAPLTLPPTFVEYKMCAIRLIQAIEESRKDPRSTRSLPDFIHTALTYASTSLLRCTQTRFAHLHPDRQQIFDLSRRAADMLAEAAIDSSHIAAIQSALVSKLITARDTPPHTAAHPLDQGLPLISPNQTYKMPLEAVAFESFARALNVDQNMTPWPPIAPMMDATGSAGGWFPDQSMGTSVSTSNLSGGEANNIVPRDMGGPPDALASWVSQQDLNIGSTGLGPGLDEFFNLGMSGNDTGFFNDAAWQSLFGNTNGDSQP